MSHNPLFTIYNENWHMSDWTNPFQNSHFLFTLQVVNNKSLKFGLHLPITDLFHWQPCCAHQLFTKQRHIKTSRDNFVESTHQCRVLKLWYQAKSACWAQRHLLYCRYLHMCHTKAILDVNSFSKPCPLHRPECQCHYLHYLHHISIGLAQFTLRTSQMFYARCSTV